MAARVLGVVLGLSLLAGLSGCVSMLQERAAQRDEVGDVDVVTVVCAGGSTPAPSEGAEPQTCPTGNSGQTAGSGDYQLLVAYRIPVAVTYPESIAAQEGTIALLFSPTFVGELNRLAPIGAGANQQWVAYISPGFSYSRLSGEQSATLQARFGLVRGADGSPWAGPFRYRTIVGYRDAIGEPSRAVTCGATLDAYSDDGTTLCMDAPAANEMGADFVVPTRDLGVLAGPRGSAPRGGSGPVSFTIAYAGPRSGPAFILSASTSIPGGMAVPAAGSITPGTAGQTILPVTVSPPASAVPGDYDVTLVAALPNGQRRSATATVSVTGRSVVDRAPPEVNLRLGKLPRIARARKVGLAPEVACSESCLLEAELRMGATHARRLGIAVIAGRTSIAVGRVRERRAAAGRRNLRVRFSKALAPLIGRARRVSLTYRVVARDASGNFRVRTARFSLRR